jgi:hypothetical protein
LTVALILFGSSNLCAQDCNCLENYDSLTETIRLNYPGFREKTVKNPKRFKQFSDSLREEIKGQKDTYQCYLSLKAFIRYFKDPHLTINFNYNVGTKSRIQKLFASNSVNIVLKEDLPVIPDKSLPIDGVWEIKGQGTYYRMRIGKNSTGHFTGVIESADSVFWFPGQVKVFVKKQEGNYYQVVYFVRDHTGVPLTVSLGENGLLNCGPYGVWQRVGGTVQTWILDSLVRASARPSISRLANGTAYIRLPNFGINMKDTLAAILASNPETLQSKNLVLDLRDNGGGSTLLSNQLLKYVYDSPIESEGTTFWTSAQNLADLESMYQRPEFAKLYKEVMKDRIARMREYPDSLVVFTEKRSSSLDTVYKNPANVYILVNKGTLSTAEIFVLQARQNKKVKIVGDFTGGAIDYTDLSLPRVLPCTLFYYQTPMTRGNHVDREILDPTGIEPDILVPKNQDALQFVINIINHE